MALRLKIVTVILCLWALPSFAQDTNLPPDQVTEAGGTSVVLRALDKITARVIEIDAKIGEEVHFGTLIIKPFYCRTRPPVEPPETFAYLEIDDVKRHGDKERVFEGWMLASSPALNSLEHPVYDVWVISCKMPDTDVDSDSL